MKKNILILSALITTFSLMAFSFMNWGAKEVKLEPLSCNKMARVDYDFVNYSYLQIKPDFVYKVDNRFMTTISKEKLDKATSIIDILPKEETQTKEGYKNVRVALVGKNDKATTEIMGDNERLNPAQIELLQSTDCTSNIRITSNCKQKNPYTNKLENYSLVYYITIVPSKEAEFKEGHEALLKYLKENSKEKITIVKKEQLQPGRVKFTINREGLIANVKLESTSGYPSIDEVFVGLIKNMPQKWNPAQNAQGEKVDQELVFFFGIEGC